MINLETKRERFRRIWAKAEAHPDPIAVLRMHRDRIDLDCMAGHDLELLADLRAGIDELEAEQENES